MNKRKICIIIVGIFFLKNSCVSVHKESSQEKITLEPKEIQILSSYNFPVKKIYECHQNRLKSLNFVEERKRIKDYHQKTFNHTLSESSLDSKMEDYSNRIDPNLCPSNEKYSISGYMPSHKTENSLTINIVFKENINQTRAGREKTFYFSNGQIRLIHNNEPAFPKVEDGRGVEAYPTGISLEYIAGVLSKVMCYYLYDPCNETIQLNPSGDVTKVVKEKMVCPKGCGNLIPFRAPGQYVIGDHKVRIRQEPNRQSAIIKELEKETAVTVIQDAEIFEQIGTHYGTWGKVKLDDGQEGYVYGAFLRAPGEPDVVAIREKAEVWKKKNGWKGK